jgi:NADPH2:quinone reductase
MKAIRVHQHGGPEALRLDELPEPRPGPGEALVAIEAAGLNFIDVYFRKGLYQAALPLTLGLEGAGTVVAVGSAVEDVRVGDRVAYTSVPGSYAQYAVAPESRLVVLPPGITTKQGAAAMLQGMTAHYLATACWPLRSGDACLVHAAAGGVGLLLCQIAKLRGARVLATVSSAEKAALARRAGADEVILYSELDFEAEVTRLTEGRGVQVVYDGVGRTTFEKGLRCLAPRGLMVLYGQASGPVAPLDPQELSARGSLFLTRPTLAHYMLTRTELVARANDVFAWIGDGRLTLRVDREYALADASQAHRALEGRETTGKVLLIP